MVLAFDLVQKAFFATSQCLFKLLIVPGSKTKASILLLLYLFRSALTNGGLS